MSATMYSTTSTFGLAIVCLIIGLLAGRSWGYHVRRAKHETSWIDGYNRGKITGRSIENARIEGERNGK